MKETIKFTGFTPEASAFYWELLFHNERPWFEEHKAQFVQLVKEPFEALARETCALTAEAYGEDMRLHVSRIYRDARRLFGRGPYKEHMWFSLHPVSWPEELSLWFEIGPGDYSYGVGVWGNPGQMEQWRKVLEADRAAAERLARRLKRQSRFRLGGEAYKRPKGDVGELLNPWYNKKSIFIECSHDFGGDVLKSELPQILTDGYRWLRPYGELLAKMFPEE
ncbi:MAG: DUF2461 domain-containing protein [Clostridiales bacterium]|nr:DUF2461 domain-containing protein [Candidatus Apopatocola equi]